MSLIYAFTTPAKGHAYPLTPILQELGDRGHEVRVWTISGAVEELRLAGLDAEPLDPAHEAVEMDDWAASKESEQAIKGLEVFLDRAPIEAEQVQREVQARRPDMLICDVNSWGSPAVAEAAGIPWVMFCPYFSWLPGKGAPPFGPGMKPLANPIGRIRDSAINKAMLMMMNRKFLAPLNELHGNLSAPVITGFEQLWHRAPRILYMTVPELEYERELPLSFSFVGPINWAPEAPTPSWLDRIENPLVLVTASTEYQQDERLLQTALDALADEPVSVVATAAGTDPSGYRVPTNARVEPFVAHEPLLERADSVICHGGMGITQKALSHGVPVCTVGWGRDQLESGRRVEVAGAGVLLPRKKLSTEALRDAWRSARSKRDGAARIARAIAKAPGAPGAADLIETEIRSPRAPQPS